MSSIWFTFIVAVQLACAVCSAENKDNKNIENLATQVVDNRIYLGKAARIEKLPYQVYVRTIFMKFDRRKNIREKHDKQCGGGILHPKIIITAAHCIHDDGERTIKVRAGSLYKDRDGVTRNVIQVIEHESFKQEFDNSGEFKSIDFDVALLRLSESLEYSKYIRNVEIPRQNDRLSPGEYGTIAGWGYIFGTTLTDVLQKTKLPVMRYEKCTGISSFIMNQRIFCAGYNKKRTSNICDGDSGSPFVKNNKIYGVASATFTNCKGAPSISYFTNVSSVHNWITTKLNALTK